MTESEIRRRGRPAKPDSERLTEKLEVRLTPAMHMKAVALGGAEWVRERIRRAKLPTEGKKD